MRNILLGANHRTIEIVGSKTFTSSGTTSTQNISLTDLTGGLDTSPQENDMVLVAYSAASAPGNPDTTMGVSGYTQMSLSWASDSSADANLWTGYKFMGSTPDTQVTINGAESSLNAIAVAIIVLRNVDQDTPLDNTVGDSTIGNTGVPNINGVHAPSSESLHIIVGANGHTRGAGAFSHSELSGVITANSNDSYDTTIGLGYYYSPYDEFFYDPVDWTWDQTDSTGFSAIGANIVLRRAY